MGKVKAGTSKKAAAKRKLLFAYAYIANGNNGTKAAIEAGFSPKSAHVAASQLLKDPKVQQLISDATAEAAKIAGLSVERTLREIARLAYSDPRKFFAPVFDAEGKPVLNEQKLPLMRLLEPWEMDSDTAATIASVEVDETKVEGFVVGHTVKVKHWDKNSALEKAMKYHGLYEADNRQKPPLIGAGTDPLEASRRIAFTLAMGAAQIKGKAE